MSIEKPALRLRSAWFAGLSSPEHIFRLGLAGKKRVDLEHWHTAIFFDRD